MAWRIEYHTGFAKTLGALPRAAQIRIAARIDLLAANPRPRDSKKLAEGIHRIRIGDYRVIYHVDDDRLIVLLLHTGHRREVYLEFARKHFRKE
jgi:mRNA interferase RelE/StbE